MVLMKVLLQLVQLQIMPLAMHLRLFNAEMLMLWLQVAQKQQLHLYPLQAFALKRQCQLNPDPLTACRPFDVDRDGFVMGEGSGILIIEELEHALARGANIISEIVGYGCTCDANHITAPHPEGLGGTGCIKMAIKDAGIKPTEIDYINTHGTSTPIGDPIETTVIKNTFGDHAKNLAISSSKSMTGHLLGAAGAVEAISYFNGLKRRFYTSNNKPQNSRSTV